MAGIHGGGKFPLEGFDERAADECRLTDHFRNGRVNLCLDGLILRVKVREWYGNTAFVCHVSPCTGSRLIRRRRRAGLPPYTPASFICLVPTPPPPTQTT